MTKNEAFSWLGMHYPTTILNDRYGGTYSGAEWIAFPLNIEDVPGEADGEDMECQDFWDNYKEPVGKGYTPDEALASLAAKISEIIN